MEKNWKSDTPTDGSYVITEQGDLGLGLTPIEEGKIEDSKEKDGGDKAPTLV